MPVLKNAKHERFAQEVAKGKTATEAYVLAGYKESRAAASRLSTNVDIQARTAELLNRGAERAECTVASLIAELEEARGIARKIEQPASMVAASMGKAKLSGLLADRVEHTGKDGGPIETVDLSETEVARRIAFTLARGARAAGDETTKH
jgi:phage terminase small subunit